MRFWSIILAILTVLILNFSIETVVEVYDWVRGGHWSEIGRGTLIGAAAFVAACLGIWFLSAIWWRKLGFKLDEEELSIRHGVISTTFRSARYERIQAVDVVEDVIARIFGLAAVRIETAGGQSSAISIMYLKKADAEALKQEVMAHIHGAPSAAVGAAAPAGTATAGTAQDKQVHSEPDLVEEVPVARTLVSTALRQRVIILSAISVGLLLLPVARTTVIPLLIGIVPSIWGIIDTSWKYTAIYDRARGVLDIRYGLADRRRQTIRLERIHAVKVSQPLLWRIFGWYEVQVSVAGYGSRGGGKMSGSTRILPVGTREQAMEVFSLVSGLNRADLEAYAQPEGHTAATYTSPSRAWLCSPLDLKRQAVTLVGEVAITHAGRINRRVQVVSTPHIQELSYQAGPISQFRKVGSVKFHLVTGPVFMQGADLDPADAAQLLARLRARELPAMDAAPMSPIPLLPEE
ncbi:PH domain-containing protein [Corynebacterium phocae]|nr:PH domain-containing protein [Corynebacterium phocae]